MKAPRPSRADLLRRHREIFEYARAHGLTLVEAKDAMARYSWKAAQSRLATVRRCGRQLEPDRPAASPTETISPPPGPEAPWMMRD